MSALLAVFPDARIIQTHRTPLDTVPSFCSMCASLAAPLTDTLDAARIGRHWLDKLSVDLARCMDTAEAHPESFLHLKFQDMVKDPISQMESVYHFTGESFGDRAEQAMRAYREDDAHQPGAHQYSLDDFGLDGEEISRRFRDLTEARLDHVAHHLLDVGHRRQLNPLRADPLKKCETGQSRFLDQP